MTEQDENAFAAWDAFAAATERKDGVPGFVAFAGAYLQQESQATHLPLNPEQADLLVRLVDSFVDEAGKRHREVMDDQNGPAKATETLEKEMQQPLFTADEIEREVKSGAAEFAGLSEQEIRDNLEGRNRLFKRLKELMFSRQGDEYGDTIAPYLSEHERAEAKRLFGGDGEGGKTPIQASDLTENVTAHVDLVHTQALLARGLQAKILADMLQENEEPADKTEAPRCLVKAFGGKLFSSAEDLVRKLAAVEFLLARMALENDHEIALPFLAVGAARAAYDWVTTTKTSYQLATLTATLDDLDPKADGEQSGKGVAK